MKILIGGIVAVVIGIIWAVVGIYQLLTLVAAILPVLLILGGGLAIYFGIDELRYPAPQVAPTEDLGKEAAAGSVPEVVTPKVAAEGAPRYWLLGYSSSNINVLREHGVLALPRERAEILRDQMQIGDRVVLYALAPESQFAGIVQISGEPRRSTEIPFAAVKEGEVWEDHRTVQTIVLPAVEKWIEAQDLLNKLDLLKEARKAGKNLSRSFAAKLGGTPQISAEDYTRIAQALGAP